MINMVLMKDLFKKYMKQNLEIKRKIVQELIEHNSNLAQQIDIDNYSMVLIYNGIETVFMTPNSDKELEIIDLKSSVITEEAKQNFKLVLDENNIVQNTIYALNSCAQLFKNREECKKETGLPDVALDMLKFDGENKLNKEEAKQAKEDLKETLKSVHFLVSFNLL